MESIHTKPRNELFWEDKCERIHCLLAQKYYNTSWDFSGAKAALIDMVTKSTNSKELSIAIDNIEIFYCVFDCINWDVSADLTKKLF
ncbi:Hypothetical protein PACV_20 [Pacmanvirus A23]|uniref:Hypothetical protein n=1 Tax=Pacmanvirus A23 TaxID=1932881 RepID=UPI000A09363A|nr:Hypothetical protein B9W72_gp020 [Pacmanvirus A23]SIP85737.1 Hypothetical protein PACV_20 [Pacmanvirus A23]